MERQNLDVPAIYVLLLVANFYSLSITFSQLFQLFIQFNFFA